MTAGRGKCLELRIESSRVEDVLMMRSSQCSSSLVSYRQLITGKVDESNRLLCDQLLPNQAVSKSPACSCFPNRCFFSFVLLMMMKSVFVCWATSRTICKAQCRADSRLPLVELTTELCDVG